MKKRIKTPLLLLGLAILSVILHNFISSLIKKEEPVFFILTFVFLFGAIVSVFYNIIKSFTKKSPPAHKTPEDKKEKL